MSKADKVFFNTDHNETLIDLMNQADRKIVVLSHLNPDGDALGSSLALYHLFTKLGHGCQVILPNDFPDFLKWLPGSEQIVIFKKNASAALQSIRNADLVFSLDFNELKRVKELKEEIDRSPAYKVLIDHHPDPAMTVDYLMSDITVSSTAELVYYFIQNTGLEHHMNDTIASCLFTGIMTDTGCFSYNSSGRRTWETVASLLSYGIDKDRIYALTYDNYSEHRMRLLGFSLNEKMEILHEFGTGFIVLSLEDLDKYHFEPGDSEGFVNYPMAIQGIKVSALFTEKEENFIRISFRSKGDFPVNEFAKLHFNGGGHKNAAGGESYESLSDTIQKFKNLLIDYKFKLKPE